jgi:phosphoribosylformylglycinamidine (FGAM) synthase-like enzyme
MVSFVLKPFYLRFQVAPFPGAETGAGGRIRDTHATGTGSLVVASTAGYCVGNLQIEGNTAPWEDTDFVYPPNLAPPLQVYRPSYPFQGGLSGVALMCCY